MEIFSIQAYLDGGTKFLWTTEGKYHFDYAGDSKNRGAIYYNDMLISGEVLKTHIIKLKELCDNDKFNDRLSKIDIKYIKRVIEVEYNKNV